MEKIRHKKKLKKSLHDDSRSWRNNNFKLIFKMKTFLNWMINNIIRFVHEETDPILGSTVPSLYRQG
jgi:hypothetical protein